MIKARDVVKKYGDLTALDGLSFDVKSGTIFGLLGVNGAGKSTILSILNGLSKMDGGDIKIDGLDIDADTEEIKRFSSLIPQNLAFYDKLSVEENLEFFAKIQNADDNNYKKAIEINSLSDLLNQRASTLSGGQKRRLNIAIGLLNNPKIIYFDEPTVGIDPKSRKEILQSIKEYKNFGITVVYTSHYMDEVAAICDEVAIISHGKLVVQEALSESLNLEKQFLELTRDDYV